MKCEDVRAMVNTPIHLSTLAMRVGARNHVQGCDLCRRWAVSGLTQMIRSGQAKPENILRGVGIAVMDDLSEDPEAHP